jgi:hypothetical protein
MSTDNPPLIFFKETYLDIVDNNFEEMVGQHVSGLLGTTITNVGHQVLALESPSDSVVNSLGFPP